jgi:hypothetical protein
MENLSFTLSTVVQKFDEDKANNLADPINCKKYITEHIFPMRGASFIVLENGEAVNYDKQSLKTAYLDKLDKSLSNWFFTKYIGMFSVVCELGKPLVYDDKINVCPQFLHNRKSYDEYSSDIKASVELWKSYMLEVLANDRQDVLNYLLKCYSKIAKGEKLDVCLYFRSPERCGKSKNTDFLREYVFGQKLSIISNSEPLRTTYNKPLLGKLIVIFEELETSSQREWESMSCKLKQMITGNTLMYSNKFEKAYESKNINNYFINTNVEAIQHSEGNRYFCCDVSTKRKADTKYFANLTNKCFNNEVGEAVFNYLLSIDTSDFVPQRDMPETNNKLDAIADRLPIEYKFLKTNYILRNISVKSSVQDLYDEYALFCKGEEKNSLTKNKFCAKLREIGIDYSSSNSKKVYRISHADLMQIATKCKWIHALDEFTKQSNDNDLDFGVPNEVDEKDKIINDLRKQLEEMKKLLDEATKAKPQIIKKKNTEYEFIEDEPDTKEEEKPELKKTIKMKVKKVKSDDVDDIILSFDE